MKNTRKKLYETKIFYVCLCAGLFGVLVVGIMQNRQNTKENDYSLADLNEPAVENPIAKATELPVETVQKPGITAGVDQSSTAEKTTDGTVADSQTKTTADNSNAGSKTASQEQTKADTSEKTADEDSVAVLSSKNKNTFSFDEEDGLLWPINGELLMKFNMDSGVYFKTLGQYKCNPAILIGGTTGAEVYSAAAGKVTEIVEDVETGMTVTMDIGNDYELVDGQLGDLKVKKGDLLSEGQVIGTLEEPTRYYVEEGCNLYFEVLEKGEPVDPMLLLR